MNLEYNQDNKYMILKLRKELDQKEVDCIIKLKEIKIQNNELINELKKKNAQNEVIVKNLAKQKVLLEKTIERYKECLDEDNIGKINDNEEIKNGLDFINEPDNENIIKFFKENENQIKFISFYAFIFVIYSN